MINQDALYWIWLAEKCGAASMELDKLLQKYQNPFDIYSLENEEIEQLDGISDNLKAELCLKNLDKSYETLCFCKTERIDIITYSDKRYPARLKNIQDPPVLLYCKGHFPSFNDTLCIAMVGTRNMSEYGKQSAYKIAYELSAADVLVVSGMALGIDGVAASGALMAGGKTVAVLGCGIDVVYPKNHARLCEQIARHGAVITEYPPKTEPRGYNFPKRNRIISALCQGTLIVEAAEKSGALITAKRAIEQGREVFAIPGKINDEGATGPNMLIREGAYPVLVADDILKHYEFLYSDVIDKNKLAKARLKMPKVDAALEKYGLAYAVGGEETVEKTYSPRKKRKNKVEEVEVKPVEAAKSVEAEAAKPEVERDADNTAVESLDAVTRRILEALPCDKAVSIDKLSLDGISVTETITALTMLEIYGLVASLPGGLYIRK